MMLTNVLLQYMYDLLDYIPERALFHIADT